MRETPDKIAKLVEDYESLTSGRVPDSFDEAQLKQSFINPFFEALGWNVRNPSEVSVEKRVHIRESTKSADYCFLLNNKPQFIVETKNINKKLTNSDYIFQTKLYGYNLPAPLGVLTNFGRFRLYDTGLEPDYDNPARGLIKKYDLSYADYLDRWDDIYDTFSRSAVESGSLVELIPKSRRVRNKEALDIKFFERLTGWRKKFAEKIALRNPHLRDEYLINEAVQRILDRMVFIRVIEDRGIESVQLLRDALNRWSDEKEKPLYQYMVDKFRYLDPHYNGQLFEKHPLSENLIIDDDLIRQFIESLYYPKSPYQFNKIGVEMLGTIYERFLGSTIRLTPAHRAKVEEKPEVRKAEGVYYTPKYIVDYIVENTVGELLKKCKTPRAVANLKILDPACGSGSFLLGAFQRLIDWHEEYYNENPDKIRKGISPAIAGCWYDKETERWKLTAKEKGKILVNNIHGVDIDPSAVEVTIMSLYLKVLEDTDTEFLIKTALLPPLHRNVKCGNSLIGSDYWDFIRDRQGELFERTLSEERRVNTFDWEDEFEEIMKPRPRHRRGATQQAGFDAVIGNPPYGAEYSDNENKYIGTKFETTTKDSAAYFLEVSCKKTKDYYGMIVPKSIGFYNTWKSIRDYLFANSNLSKVCDVGLGFDIVNYEEIILCFKKGRKRRKIGIYVAEPIKRYRDPKEIRPDGIIDIELMGRTGAIIFRGCTEYEISVLNKIEENSVSLGEITSETFRGLYIPDKEKENLKKGNWIWINKVPDVKRYYISKVDEIDISHNSKWLKKAEKILRPRLFFKVLRGNRLVAYPDVEGAYLTTEKLVNLIVETESRWDYRALSGIINSTVPSFYIQTLLFSRTTETSRVMDGIYSRYIPIPKLDFSDPAGLEKHDEMVSLVEEMLSLHERLADVKSDADRTRLLRAIKKTDKKIDALVYELYNLTDEDIAIVQEGQHKW